MSTTQTTTTNKITACWKCDGSGFIRAFSHIADGRCFTCCGAGKVVVKPSTATGATVAPQWVPDEEVLASLRSAISAADSGGAFYYFREAQKREGLVEECADVVMSARGRWLRQYANNWVEAALRHRRHAG